MIIFSATGCGNISTIHALFEKREDSDLKR
jgi:predicted GTPase